MITKAAFETQQYELTSHFLIGPCINIFDDSRRFLNGLFRFTVFARVVRIVLLQLYGEMASWLQRLDGEDLEKCYENDLDWTLMPEKLREVSICMLTFFFLKRCRFDKRPSV